MLSSFLIFKVLKSVPTYTYLPNVFDQLSSYHVKPQVAIIVTIGSYYVKCYYLGTSIIEVQALQQFSTYLRSGTTCVKSQRNLSYMSYKIT